MKRWTERLVLFLFATTLFAATLIVASLFSVSVSAADQLNVTQITQAVYSGQMKNSFFGDYGQINLMSTLGTNYGVLLDNGGRTYSSDQTAFGSLKLVYSANPLYSQNYSSGIMTITYTNESGSFYSVGLQIPLVSMNPGASDTVLYYDSNGRPWFDSSLSTTPAVNSPPAITLSNQAVNENSNLLFTVLATDADGDAIIGYDSSTLPIGAVFNVSTGQFNWTPTYDQSGPYPVTFYANDSFSQNSTTITITVNNVNRIPILNSIGPQAVPENSTINFTLSGSDPDGTPISFGAFNLPANANWNNETLIFNWTPNFTQANVYSVTFNVTDGTDTTNETVAITVTNFNAGPEFLSLQGNQVVNENQTLIFAINATDPDNDALVYSVIPFPAGATINATTGFFNWTPNFTQNSVYTVDLNASDGTESVVETITITVVNQNAGPELFSPGDQVVNEAQMLELTISATDPDNDILTYGYNYDILNNPVGATFNPLTRIFNWTPTYDQNNTYRITFNVTDGTLEFDEKNITITVNNVNRAPTLNAIGNQSVLENATLEFYINGLDADLEPISFDAYNLPEGATFNQTLKLFNWTTNFTNNNTYINVAFNVTDGIATTEELINITVENVNQVPSLAAIPPQTINENQTLTFTAVGSDEDQDLLTYYLENPPADAAIDINTGVFTWTPNFTQNAVYSNVIIGVNDSLVTFNETITITVNNVNAGPELTLIGDRVVDENQTLDFTITATDLDNDALVFSPLLNLPDNADFITATGRFIWTPNYTQSGTYFDVVFNVSDGTFWDSENISLTVNNVNRRPVLDTIGDKTVNEGTLLTFTLNANDPDSDSVLYNSSFDGSDLPGTATFDPTTKTFSWTPSLSDAGTYLGIMFNATDGDQATSLNASETITITVLNFNQPPILNSIGDKSGIENSTLNFTLSGSDPDGNTVAYEVYGLPSGAAFDNVTLIFNWTPNLTQSGTYLAGFNITDGSLNDTEEITITINNLNIAPVFNNTPDQNVAEGNTLTFVVDGSDPDNDPITVSNLTLPDGALFNSATRTFNWTPGLGQNGTYVVTFVLNDGNFNVSMNVTITVGPVPRNVINSNIYDSFYPNNFNSEVSNAVVNNSFIIDSNITNSSGLFIVDINSSFFNESIVADASAFWNCTLLQTGLIREECIDLYSDNSYIRDSNTTGSTIINSTVTEANLTWSTAVESTIFNFASITLSDINFSWVNNSVIDNSALTADTNVEESVISQSNLSRTNVGENSTITSSDISESTIANSTLTNVVLANVTIAGSIVSDSTLSNSVIDNMYIANSSVTNTTLTNAILNNSLVIDGIIYNGTIIIDGNEINITNPTNLSDLINYAPTASLSVPASATAGDSVQVDASATSDPNIPGQLNDSLEFFFDFGDGTNYTENSTFAADGVINARTTHSYSSAGTYDVRLTVSDLFGQIDTANTTIVISAAPPQPSGGGGGGGGGGSYYSAPSGGPKMQVYETSTMQSSWSDMRASGYKVNFKTLNYTVTSVEFELNDNLSNGTLQLIPVASSPAVEVVNNSYAYFELEHNIPSTNMSSEKIYFRVEKSWLNSSSINPDDIRLYRYTLGSAWVMLMTDHLKSDPKYEYYVASSPGFSYFAIGSIGANAGAQAVSAPGPATLASNESGTGPFVVTILPSTSTGTAPSPSPTVIVGLANQTVSPAGTVGNLSENLTSTSDKTGMSGITGAAIFKSGPARIGFFILLVIVMIFLIVAMFRAMTKPEEEDAPVKKAGRRSRK